MSQAILSVSDLTQQLKAELFERGLVEVRGEISNYKKYGSGHMYFALKDESAQLKAVMFSGDSWSLKFLPADGLMVDVSADLDLYQARGDLQLIVRKMIPAGRGSLMEAFEKLKAKLAKEGLFDPESKQALPKFPERVALVTSPQGAALRDMIHVMRARWPAVKLILEPVQVQGDAASESIVRGLRRIDHWGGADVIIVGRGGGSLEDLWAFNEEPVARAIAECRTPVISAVGHETDFSISDFAADHRAATPSSAGAVAVPDAAEYKKQMDAQRRRLVLGVNRVLERRARHLEHISRAHGLRRPKDFLRTQAQFVDSLAVRLVRAERTHRTQASHRLDRLSDSLYRYHPKTKLALGAARVEQARASLQRGGLSLVVRAQARLDVAAKGLSALDPSAVLERGYAVVRTDAWDGPLVTGADQLRPQTQAHIQFARDRAKVLVLTKESGSLPESMNASKDEK